MLIGNCLQAQNVRKKIKSIIKLPAEIMETALHPISFYCQFPLVNIYFIKTVRQFDCIFIGNTISHGSSSWLALNFIHSLLPIGPPGPPGVVIVEEITESTATLSWSPAADNHSPISSYNLQARSPFSLGWQTVKTSKRL